MLSKVVVLTLSDTEDYIIEKVMSVLTGEKILLKSDISNRDKLHFGKLAICPSQRKVYLNGTEIFLTTKELDLLIYLASHNGQVFTIRQIYGVQAHVRIARVREQPAGHLHVVNILYVRLPHQREIRAFFHLCGPHGGVSIRFYN